MMSVWPSRWLAPLAPQTQPATPLGVYCLQSQYTPHILPRSPVTSVLIIKSIFCIPAFSKFQIQTSHSSGCLLSTHPIHPSRLPVTSVLIIKSMSRFFRISNPNQQLSWVSTFGNPNISHKVTSVLSIKSIFTGLSKFQIKASNSPPLGVYSL